MQNCLIQVAETVKKLFSWRPSLMKNTYSDYRNKFVFKFQSCVARYLLWRTSDLKIESFLYDFLHTKKHISVYVHIEVMISLHSALFRKILKIWFSVNTF